jgi:hypothetical protein
MSKRKKRKQQARAATNGHEPAGRYTYREYFAQPDPAEEFFTRPGDYYIAKFEIGGHVDDIAGVTFIAESVFKADDQQLPYLIEVIRQIRGAFGDKARVRLTKALAKQQTIKPPAENARGAVDSSPRPDLSRAQLQEQLPGMTRAALAAEIGVRPAEIGGDVNSVPSEISVEELAAELGVSPLDLQPIDMIGGGRAYAVKPGAAMLGGRHAAPDAPEEVL